jgi:hypothetical protein
VSGDLKILREDTLVEIPRGDRGEVLRLTFAEGEMGPGKRVAWHALRVWFRDDAGQLRPGKSGVTIRGRELKPIAEALSKAASDDGDRAQQQPRASGHR